MSDKPYVNFYTSDFLAGTGGMTAACKGVYITLLCQMYEAEAPLGQSWDALARRCGATLPAFKKAVETLVEDGKIVVTDDGIWSPKCEKHITLRRERQNSAKAAAKTRWKKSKEKQGKADADAVKPQCQPEPEPDIYSVTNVTGATAPQAVDFTKEVFDRGVAFLGKYGTAEKQARGLIGKWRKQAGDTETFNALRDANREGVTEPVGWITARLKGKASQPSVAELFAELDRQKGGR